METKVKENGTAVNNSKVNNPVTEENKHPKFVAGNAVNKDSAKLAEAKQPEPVKPEAVKEKLKEAAQQAAHPQPVKVVLNLEGTLKLVEEMHRKIKQRTKLQETITNLESFDVELRDEADTTDTNYYTGCKLVIEDDKRHSFETKNPTIIWAVAQMVNSMCVDKLAEIEAGIVLPQ